MAGFNFNLQKVLKEAAEFDSCCKDKDLDKMMDKIDLDKVFDQACPITGTVAEKLREQMCDPLSLRIVYNEADRQFYMDYAELVNFCEATGYTDVTYAVDRIVEAYNPEYPMTKDTLNIVFPMQEAFSNALKGQVGYQDIVWSSHFMSNCINKGLKCTTFVDGGQPQTQKKNDVECC